MDLDYASWSPWTWALQAVGALFLAGFFSFWFRFARGERAARAGGPGAVQRYNRSLRGFPNGFYAKMFGKRPFDLPKGEGLAGGEPR